MRFYELIREGVPVRKAFSASKEFLGQNASDADPDRISIWPNIESDEDIDNDVSFIPI